MATPNLSELIYCLNRINKWQHDVGDLITLEDWLALIRDDPALFAEIAAANAYAESVKRSRQGADAVIDRVMYREGFMGATQFDMRENERHGFGPPTLYDMHPDAFEVAR